MLKATFLLTVLFAVNTEFTIEAGSVNTTNKYVVSLTPASFLQAWAYCNNKNLQFVSIPSLTQHKALASSLTKDNIPTVSLWIGGMWLEGFRTENFNQWFWVNGQEPFSWSHWDSAPSVKNDDTCIVYNYDADTKSGSWSTDYCENQKFFVCLS
ncbi:hypothetical protein ABEB36_007447 [Hypothenemus hampei]|uniref:C-type lectin domain-containing protein n=1 Tax=Hypothenemus hampei TaxID=57062 RepID=A0ABD1EXZ8_HYPHA